MKTLSLGFKLNPDKFQMLLNNEEQITLKAGNLHIKSSKCKILSGININCKLTWQIIFETFGKKHQET